jgi:nucleotide-binding universal stress UspA family protein
VTASEGGPYARIVVGTDGSATAASAVRHAAQLAVACGARLTIVSAYRHVDPKVAELEVPTGADDEWMATDAAGAQDHVVDGLEVAKAEGASNVHGRTEAGDPAAVLLDVSEDVSADLIMVGSRGMAAPSRFLLGSVPNRVSHHAPCDVVIVRTAD